MTQSMAVRTLVHELVDAIRNASTSNSDPVTRAQILREAVTEVQHAEAQLQRFLVAEMREGLAVEGAEKLAEGLGVTATRLNELLVKLDPS